jgi:hypothetical protein
MRAKNKITPTPRAENVLAESGVERARRLRSGESRESRRAMRMTQRTKPSTRDSKSSAAKRLTEKGMLKSPPIP